MPQNLLIEHISLVDATLYEEDSYDFLQFFQFYNEWHVYDSLINDYDLVYKLTENFINFHGKIPFPEDLKLQDSYWSVYPLGVFRFKLLASGECAHVAFYDTKPGYVVEGMYWQNGFFYLVKEDSKIIQIKLFIDSETKKFHGYPN